MVKEKDNKIKLDNITVYYGKTTLKQLIKSNYEVKDGWFTFHKESSTVLCSFFKDEEYMGELTFFDITEMPSLDELKESPIDLVLLDKEPPQSEKNGYLEFMDFKGKAGKKDMKLLAGFYLFCWLIIILCYKEIPSELICITALLPIAFFGFSFLFWGLKSFFSYLYDKFSRVSFVAISCALFLLWTCFATFLFFEAKATGIKYYDIPLAMILILLLLIVSGFFIYQIICFWAFDKAWKDWKVKVKKYLPVHLVLYVSLASIYLLSEKVLSISRDSFTDVFFLFVFLQLILYSAFSLIVWMKVLLYILFDMIIPSQKRNKS